MHAQSSSSIAFKLTEIAKQRPSKDMADCEVVSIILSILRSRSIRVGGKFKNKHSPSKHAKK